MDEPRMLEIIRVPPEEPPRLRRARDLLAEDLGDERSVRQAAEEETARMLRRAQPAEAPKRAVVGGAAVQWWGDLEGGGKGGYEGPDDVVSGW